MTSNTTIKNRLIWMNWGSLITTIRHSLSSSPCQNSLITGKKYTSKTLKHILTSVSKRHILTTARVIHMITKGLMPDSVHRWILVHRNKQRNSITLGQTIKKLWYVRVLMESKDFIFKAVQQHLSRRTINSKSESVIKRYWIKSTRD